MTSAGSTQSANKDFVDAFLSYVLAAVLNFTLHLLVAFFCGGDSTPVGMK